MLEHRARFAGERDDDDRAGWDAPWIGAARSVVDPPPRFLRVFLPEDQEHAALLLDGEGSEPVGPRRDGESELHERHGLARAPFRDELTGLAKRQHPLAG